MPNQGNARPLPDPEHCFHCGEPVPPGVDFTIRIGGHLRPMCCPGCRAVAGLIGASGLEDFYRQRTAYAIRPAQQASPPPEQYRVYDDPALYDTFTRREDTGALTARLLLTGVSCAACTWLIERALRDLPGVESALVNLQQSRLDIRFDPERIALSELFARVEALGYRARPFHAGNRRQQMAAEYRQSLRRLAVAGLGMMQVGMFAIALHAGDIQGIEAGYQGLLRWVSLLVSGFVVLFSARPFFTTAWRHLRHGALVMDLPVALAIGLAWTASAWATVTGTGQVYFDSVVMFTFFLLLGRFFEQRVRQHQSLAWSDAEAALPDAASVLRAGHWVAVPRMQLAAGDLVLVRPGETVPADAEVEGAGGAVREDTFNGEHLPRAVTAGDRIYAGTVNVEQALQARVTGSYAESRLAALQRSVDEAQTGKPRLAQLADRVASWFVGAILVITGATGFVWYQLAPGQAFWVSLSVLVISCPCALALATPAALTSAASALRGAGVIVRGENALEALARATHLIFDKTGTLTEGALRVQRVALLGERQRGEVMAIAAALQQFSSHPVARAFAGQEVARGVTDAHYEPGAGLEASLDGIRYRIGSEHFCRALAPMLPPPPQEPLYWIALCGNAVPLAWIGLADRTRPESAAVVDRARDMGFRVELLTGDSSGQGSSLARSLGMDDVRSGMTPAQKMAHVDALQRAGAVVTMVGDGLNDAPVLGLADASFAVAGATELARTQADFVLLEGDLFGVIQTVHTARRCRRIILQNFAWALLYNCCALPLAAAGQVPPWAAALGMSFSSLLVVANSLRLNSRRHFR